MHLQILTQKQTELLPFLNQFRKEYYLAGGTAVALYIGHRRSLDFDFFKTGGINPKKILEKLNNVPGHKNITRRVQEQLNITLNGVKLTFLEYPFTIEAKTGFKDLPRLPSLIDLAAMKAYALGRRSKWKDYVDLYFLIRDYYSIKQISNNAVNIFQDLFSEKLFRAQLSYFEDIDYSETVEFTGHSIPDNDIKTFLIERSTEILE